METAANFRRPNKLTSEFFSVENNVTMIISSELFATFYSMQSSFIFFFFVFLFVYYENVSQYVCLI